MLDKDFPVFWMTLSHVNMLGLQKNATALTQYSDC